MTIIIAIIANTNITIDYRFIFSTFSYGLKSIIGWVK